MNLAEGLAAVALITVGVWFAVSWPVALIVAGCLVLLDRLT